MANIFSNIGNFISQPFTRTVRPQIQQTLSSWKAQQSPFDPYQSPFDPYHARRAQEASITGDSLPSPMPSMQTPQTSQVPQAPPPQYNPNIPAQVSSLGMGTSGAIYPSVTNTSSVQPFEDQVSALQKQLEGYAGPSAEEQEQNQLLKNLMTSEDLGIEQVREKPIAMPFITGQSAAIQRSAAIQAQPLINQIASLQQKRDISRQVTQTRLQAASDRLTREESRQKEVRDRWSDPFKLSTGVLAQRNLGTGKIDELGSMGSAGTGGLTPYQETNTFSGIVKQYNSSPLIMASDRTPVLRDAIANIRQNPSNGALQLNLAYSYIQALDTYQSAVREGELYLVNSIDSKVGQIQGWIQQIQNGQIVRPDVAKQIASAAEQVVNTISTAAQAKAKSFQSQADVNGVGPKFQQYLRGFTPSYQGNTGTPQANQADLDYLKSLGY